MENWGLLLEGFSNALTAENLMYGLLGTFLGTLVGVLPGIGPALAIALLLPVTLSVNPTSALIMFAAVFYGAMYGGSTTSILLNTPGEAGAVITSVEGHKMAKKGRAGFTRGVKKYRSCGAPIHRTIENGSEHNESGGWIYRKRYGKQKRDCKSWTNPR